MAKGYTPEKADKMIEKARDAKDAERRKAAEMRELAHRSGGSARIAANELADIHDQKADREAMKEDRARTHKEMMGDSRNTAREAAEKANAADQGGGTMTDEAGS